MKIFVKYSCFELVQIRITTMQRLRRVFFQKTHPFTVQASKIYQGSDKDIPKKGICSFFR
jgi:hypothetical protein